MSSSDGPNPASDSRSCPAFRDSIVRYVDGTASDEERAELEAHLRNCPICRDEVEGHTHIARTAHDMRFVDLPDDAWHDYWQNTYNRMERTIGWLLVVIGFIVVGVCALARFTQWLVTNETLGLIEKVGLSVLVLGLALVVLGVIRERIALRRFDRYWRIKR